MTEHTLKSEVYSLVLHKLKAKRDADHIRDSVARMAKAYAASQVAELKAEIEGLAANLQGQVEARKRDLASKSELNQENRSLNQEIERLKAALGDIKSNLGYKSDGHGHLVLNQLGLEIDALLSPKEDGEPIEPPAPDEFADMAMRYELSRTDDFKDCHDVCDRCETMFNGGIDSKCPACGCVDFHDPNDEEE